MVGKGVGAGGDKGGRAGKGTFQICAPPSDDFPQLSLILVEALLSDNMKCGQPVSRKAVRARGRALLVCGRGMVRAREIIDTLPDHIRHRTSELFGDTFTASLLGACIAGSESAAKMALNGGADPNAVVAAVGVQLSPLVAACEKGHLSCVSLLLLHGANANTSVYNGQGGMRNPLLAALTNRNDAIAALLVTQGGANVDEIVSVESGYTPLMTACYFRCRECTRALLECGADVNAVRERHRDQVGEMTVLMDMCLTGDEAAVGMLLDGGAHVNQQATDGATALFFAAQDGAKFGCMQRLLAARADAAHTRHDGGTALVLASQEGQTDKVACLLAHGAAADGSSETHPTPINQACARGHYAIVNLLLRASAHADVYDSAGRTPLMNASAAGHTACVEALLGAGAAVDRRVEVMDSISFEFTALTFAAGGGHLQCTQLLRIHGAAEGGHGPSHEAMGAPMTASELAERRGFPETACWLRATRNFSTPLHFLELISTDRALDLLRAGADVHARVRPDDECSPSPLELARRLRVPGAPTAHATAAAALVERASAPWSPTSHGLFPAEARARAVHLITLGYLLARHVAGGEEQTMVDVWLDMVMPRAITRDGK